MRLHEPLTNLEAAILAEHSGDAEDRVVERLETQIVDLCRRLEEPALWHTIARGDLMTTLHACAFSRLHIYHQRDQIAQLKQRCYEQTLDSLCETRGIAHGGRIVDDG